MSTTPDVSDFSDFLDLLRVRLDLPLAEVAPTARLVEDLGLDSILIFELVMMIEGEAGRLFPEELIESIRTIGDVFGWYEQVLGSS